MIKIFQGGLETVLLILGRIFISAMLIITVADIVLRNVLNKPLPGVVELVEFSLAIVIFAGIPVAWWRGSHLVVDLLEVILSPQVLKLLDIANGILGFFVSSVLAWLCYERFLDALDWGDTTVDLGIPLTAFWLSPTVGFAVAAFFSLIRTARQLRRVG